MKHYLKGLVERIPYSVGKYLTVVPFSFRLGKQYTEFSRLLASTSAVDEDYVIRNFSSIFYHARVNFPFYQKLYKESGVHDLEIKTLSDIEKVPVIDKDMIRPFVSQFSGGLKLNTGGTSGSPFAFYVDNNAFAREWAHMHKIWSFRNYNYRDVKLTLRGKNLGDKTIVFNPVHNEFIVNTYRPLTDYIDEIIALIDLHDIKYLHGYPSAIYNFLKELSACASSSDARIFKRHIKCCLLGSEFPVPYMADYIKDQWSLDYISWYGHSEMCILAYDKNSKNEYTPFHSYGYAEVDGERLIGTSYHNYDMPLIRYDTGDLVSGKKAASGLLNSFSIKEGRSGDFIVDKTGKKIPLTALVFGRHHEIFGYADCFQVRQVQEGAVEFLITTSEDLTEDQALSLLDLSSVNIDFSVQIISKPILTSAGKMPLKV